MAWAVLAFLAFLFLILFAGWRSNGKVPPEFADLANDPGITLKRAGYSRRSAGPASPFMYGPCFEGIWRDVPVVVSTVIDEEKTVLGRRLAFSFIRPLHLALFCAFDIDAFSSAPVADEYRDVYLKRIDTGVADLKAWAKEGNQAGMLLLAGDVAVRLQRLTGHVKAINQHVGANLPGLRRAGFMINDHEVVLFVTEPSLLTRELVDDACQLSQALSGFGYGAPGESKRPEGLFCRRVAIFLAIALIGFILGTMILKLLQREGVPYFGGWEEKQPNRTFYEAVKKSAAWGYSLQEIRYENCQSRRDAVDGPFRH